MTAIFKLRVLTNDPVYRDRYEKLEGEANPKHIRVLAALLVAEAPQGEPGPTDPEIRLEVCTTNVALLADLVSGADIELMVRSFQPAPPPDAVPPKTELPKAARAVRPAPEAPKEPEPELPLAPKVESY